METWTEDTNLTRKKNHNNIFEIKSLLVSELKCEFMSLKSDKTCEKGRKEQMSVK